MDWQRFWQEYPARGDELNLFQQVGKTRHGQAITPRQFEIIVAGIVDALQLTKEDHLLDLCCGNGLLTAALAPHVGSVTAIDFSEPLIQTAQREFGNIPDLRFILGDVKALREVPCPSGVTKVLCYEALSFFDEHDVAALLHTVSDAGDDGLRVLLASVLDWHKRFRFFNTLRRRLLYWWVRLTGRDFGLGKWWRMSTLQEVCQSQGFEARCIEQPAELHTSHFRTDVVAWKRPVQ